MITVVDYGASNLKSVEKAFKNLGHDVTITNDYKLIESADKLVLPGNGTFGDCVSNLKNLNIYDSIKEFIAKERYFLGICIGMQVLADTGNEFGIHNGFGLIAGKVEKFELEKKYKIPHIGWNMVKYNEGSKLFNGIDNNSHFYFVHSYHFDVEDKKNISSKTEYGIEFVSSIEYNNILGTQFHPEKSQKVGLKLLENFCKL